MLCRTEIGRCDKSGIGEEHNSATRAKAATLVHTLSSSFWQKWYVLCLQKFSDATLQSTKGKVARPKAPREDVENHGGGGNGARPASSADVDASADQDDEAAPSEDEDDHKWRGSRCARQLAHSTRCSEG